MQELNPGPWAVCDLKHLGGILVNSLDIAKYFLNGCLGGNSCHKPLRNERLPSAVHSDHQRLVSCAGQNELSPVTNLFLSCHL